MAQEIRDVVFNIQVRTEDGAVKIEGLTKGFVKAETAFKKMQTTLNSTNEAMKGAGISTGLANTAILEFGRTVSDAPYGIQGMGNNITQLVTILGQMSQAAKEGGSVLGSLRQAFVGPLGVVIAIQLAVAAFEIYRKSQQGAVKETNKVIDAQVRAGFNLKLVRDALLDETTALSEKQEIITALNDKYPEWNLSLEESGNISQENVQKIDAEIEALERLAKAKAFQSILEDLYAEKAQKASEFAAKQGGVINALEQAFRGFGNITAGASQQVSSFADDMAGIDKEISAVTEMMKGEGLVDLLVGEGKDKQKSKKERREKVKELVIETYDIAIVEAENRKKEIEKKLKSLGLDFPSLILGGKEGKKALNDGILGLVGNLEETGTAERLEGIVKDAIFPEDVAKFGAELLGTANDLLASEADRAIDIETNKTNALNDQLKERLANEKLSAEERDKINQQISRNEAALVAKENEINKKRFEQQKALNLALAIIDTYLAANMALKDKTLVSTFARVAAMVSIIASGLANVATISRQKFTSKAMPTPNLVSQGGGGPADSQGPAFNIVGASGQSQLAQAIAAQQRDPVRAYVVAGEVTTAQSLERNKIQEASI
jgi:hypothetical protein